MGRGEGVATTALDDALTIGMRGAEGRSGGGVKFVERTAFSVEMSSLMFITLSPIHRQAGLIPLRRENGAIGTRTTSNLNSPPTIISPAGEQ
jgi:hypothetical protein